MPRWLGLSQTILLHSTAWHHNMDLTTDNYETFLHIQISIHTYTVNKSTVTHIDIDLQTYLHSASSQCTHNTHSPKYQTYHTYPPAANSYMHALHWCRHPEHYLYQDQAEI